MAEYKLKLDLPTRPKGEEIEVPPYGMVENGDTTTIQATEEEAYKLARSHGITVLDSSGKVVVAPKQEEEPTPTPTPTTPEGGEE